MKTKKETLAQSPKRLGLVWQLMIGALVGAGAVVGLKVGWQRLVGWAKGVKSENVTRDNLPLYGAIGALMSVGMNYELVSNKDKDDLIADNVHLHRKVDQLTAARSFTQQVSDEKPHAGIQPNVR